MADLFGVEVSLRFLDSLYSEGSSLLTPFLAEVLRQLKSSEVVHMAEDVCASVKETGMVPRRIE